jgi:hypothetical protein
MANTRAHLRLVDPQSVSDDRSTGHNDNALPKSHLHPSAPPGAVERQIITLQLFASQTLQINGTMSTPPQQPPVLSAWSQPPVTLVPALNDAGAVRGPSCGGRRMADTAANLVDHVLPHAPVRQWVLSFPFPHPLPARLQPATVRRRARHRHAHSAWLAGATRTRCRRRGIWTLAFE